MLKRIFPKTVDNQYRGHKIGLWLLYVYIFKSLFSGCIHMFAPDGGAQSIASIALDTFSEEASNTVITIFGLWGMEQFVIGLIALVVVVRYRALISVISLAYVIEYFGRFFMGIIQPGVYTEYEPPGVIADYVLVPMTLLVLLLTLYRNKKMDSF
ncbi:hypothetical protein A165_15160 [Vibrio tasmaniensis ZS-17]|nr:hypothetical protein A165_15160 [Vibrio tasmaniensis ZS-17]